MNNISAVMLIAVMISGCATLPGSTPTPQPPRATMTPSPVSTPTLDTAATLAVQLDGAIKSAEAARRAELEAQQAEIYAVQTAQAVQLGALVVTVTLGAQEIEQAAIHATAGSVSSTRRASEYAEWAARQTATVEAPALVLTMARAQSNAATQTIRDVINSLSVLVMTIIVMLIIVFGIVSRIPPEVFTDDENEPEEVLTTDENIENQYPGGLSLSVFTGIATPDQLATLAAGVLAGKPLTHAEWTPASVMFSEGKFQSIQYVLVRYGLATWNDDTHKSGITPTGQGWDWLRAMASTPPPSDDGSGMRETGANR